MEEIAKFVSHRFLFSPDTIIHTISEFFKEAACYPTFRKIIKSNSCLLNYLTETLKSKKKKMLNLPFKSLSQSLTHTWNKKRYKIKFKEQSFLLQLLKAGDRILILIIGTKRRQNILSTRHFVYRLFFQRAGPFPNTVHSKYNGANVCFHLGIMF